MKKFKSYDFNEDELSSPSMQLDRYELPRSFTRSHSWQRSGFASKYCFSWRTCMHIVRSSAFPLSFDLLIKTETRNISSWLSGFWRVSFEWKITYMLMACLDSARLDSGCFCCLLCANGLSSFSPRAAVFCFKKRSVFTARFFLLPFWESYFSISPYIPGAGEWDWVKIEWKKNC